MSIVAACVAILALTYKSGYKEMALRELALVSQDLVGSHPLLVRVQNYHNRQSIVLHEGGLIALASTK